MAPPRTTIDFTIHLDTKLDQLREEIVAIIAANDVRYQQRFEAQGKALDAAFGAAKEAVSAALAAQDKAAVKSELTADKRFSDMGDLIREQFRGMADKLEGLVQRMTTAENRLNLSSGEVTGGKETKENARQTWLLALAIIGGALGLISFFMKGQ